MEEQNLTHLSKKQVLTDNQIFDELTFKKAKTIINESIAENTQEAINSDLRYFWSWAEIALGLAKGQALSEKILIRFFVDHLQGMDEGIDRQLVEIGIKASLGPHKFATVERRVYLMARWNELKGEGMIIGPHLKEIVKAARKKNVPKKCSAITKDILNRLCSACTNDLIGIRDEAILRLAFSSGGRRPSEVVKITLENLYSVEGGFQFYLDSSKTESKRVALPVVEPLAAKALERWLDCLKLTGIVSGPLFRRIYKGGKISDSGPNSKYINVMVKKYAKLAQIEQELSARSIRRGFVTESGIQNKDIRQTMALTRHKDVSTFLGYFDEGRIAHNEAAKL